MRNGYSILTRRFKGLDVNIWLSLMTIILLSSGILIFKIATDVKCENFGIITMDVSGSQKNSLFVNEDVTFKANVTGKVAWDFDDGTTAKGLIIKHIFLNSGDHVIKAILNEKCPQLVTVRINKKIVNQDDQEDIDPISGPESAIVGKRVTFSYTGKKKNASFEWSVVNSQIYSFGHENRVTYVFKSPGSQIVQLQLNKDEAKTFKKSILILPVKVEDQPVYTPRPTVSQRVTAPPPIVGQKPDTPQKKQVQQIQSPETKKLPATDLEFRQMFEDVIAGKKTDQYFTSYLCNGTNTQVLASEKNDVYETVESLCKKLFKSRYKIEAVTAVKDGNGCVTKMLVKYKKKSIIPF
jgi:hypothetical protein